MKFYFKYLALFCLLTNSAVINASDNNSMHMYPSNKHVIVYIPIKDNHSHFYMRRELLDRYTIFSCGDFSIDHIIIDDNHPWWKSVRDYDKVHGNKAQNKVNSKRLSVNIGHSLFLFRSLVNSMKQFRDDIRNGFFHDSVELSGICRGFMYVFEYIIEKLVNYKANNNVFDEKTISDITKQRLIDFEWEYNGEMYSKLLRGVITDNKIDQIYNEFNQILTEENNKISHSYDPWYKNIKHDPWYKNIKK